MRMLADAQHRTDWRQMAVIHRVIRRWLALHCGRTSCVKSPGKSRGGHGAIAFFMTALPALAVLVIIDVPSRAWSSPLPTPVSSSVVRGPSKHAPAPATTGVIYSWRGLWMRPALAIDRPTKGMLVEQVERNSPAAQAGLKPGDVIAAFDGTPVGTARNLAFAIADHCCGPTVTLRVWRDQHGRVIKLAPSPG